jgi:uncharacterized alpha/beta hydrolase family protein
MTTEQIEKGLEQIQSLIERQATIDSPVDVMEKLNDCVNVLGMSAELVAWTERKYNEKLSLLCLAKEYSKLSATDKKMVFAGALSNEIMLHTRAVEINKSLARGIDAMRSILSYVKEEMKNIK